MSAGRGEGRGAGAGGAGGSPRRGARTRRSEASDPVPVRDLLRGATAALGVRDPVATGRLWAAWPDVVGAAIARRAEPTSLRDGVLRVRAESPAWATEIAYLADEIRRRADEVVGRGTVVEVRVWTGPAPERPTGARPPDDAGPGPGAAAGAPRQPEPATRRDEATTRDEAAVAGAPVPDPAEALERARQAWARRRSRRR